MSKGCIYIVEDEPNVCKIGFTTQDPPDKRSYQLSCKHHKKFIIRGCAESYDLKEEEKEIHKFFKDYRIRGEWFKLSYDQIKEMAKQINIHFDDYDRYLKIKEFIHKARYKWCDDRECWIDKEEFDGPIQRQIVKDLLQKNKSGSQIAIG